MPPPTATLSAKLKVQLKLSVARLRMVQSRDASLTKSSHRTVAQLLEAHKPDSARIRVESIIRADILTELHEILELYCELLLARFGLLDASGILGASSRESSHNNHNQQQPVCDPGLEEAVKSIIYAAPRTEIKELVVLRALLGDKFGKEFVLKAMEGVEGGVSEKVVRRLGVEPPKPQLVEGYLEEIARAYNVDWPRGRLAAEEEGPEELDLLIDMDEDVSGDDDDKGSGGGQALAELGLLEEEPLPTSPEKSGNAPTEPSGPTKPSEAPKPAAPPPRKPATPKATELKPMPKPQPQRPQASKPAVSKPAPAVSPGSGIPDLSELEQRFAALKKLG